MSLVQKAWQEGNILTMSFAQRARQGITQQKQSYAKPCFRKKSSQYISHDLSKKYDIISGEPYILQSTMLPFFTKTLVQMAWQGKAHQTRSHVM
jgi:hypothetical protein